MTSIRQPYPPPAALPTQAAPQGIRFDFNHGARVILPNREIGSWRVRLHDLDTGNILFQSENQGASVSSAKRYFVRFGIEVWDLDAAGNATAVLSHEYAVRDQEVLIPTTLAGDYYVLVHARQSAALRTSFSRLSKPAMVRFSPNVPGSSG